MPEFIEAARVEQIPPGTGTTVKVADKEVAIFNVDGEVYAIGDSCPHAGASLGAGRLSGKIVTCRAHSLRYHVTTGQVTTGGFGVASYPVKVVDGRILIAVDLETPVVAVNACDEEQILGHKEQSIMATTSVGKTHITTDSSEAGPWDDALAILREWDPEWTESCAKMTMNPWSSTVLPRKTIELISIALNAACTNLNPEGTRRHIRAALEAGATRDEILFVFKCAALLAIHACSLGAPILLEEAKAMGVEPSPSATPAATPACDKLKAIGQWNAAWDPFVALDPVWTDAFMTTGIGIYTTGVLTPKEIELLSIALDASYTHMYAPGTRRHIQAALKVGATMEEVMEVLKLCVVQGVQACNLGVPILAEELERVERKNSE